MSDQQQFTLGQHVKMDDEFFLPVRFVKQHTLHEDPTVGVTFIMQEEFVELRNKEGKVRFAMLSSTKTPAVRNAGPCRGIKPYFWQGAPINVEHTAETHGGQGPGQGDHNNTVAGGAGEESRVDRGDSGEQSPPTH
jgi:hypothetical protein